MAAREGGLSRDTIPTASYLNHHEDDMTDRMTGKCKWFHKAKGYGFIEGDDGTLYFVHYKNIRGEGFREINEAQPVCFKPVQGPKGPAAFEVEPLAA